MNDNINIRPEYPSNSIKSRGERHMDLRPQQQTPEKKITRVTTGSVKKQQKSFIDKFSEIFWGEDAGTIGNYVIYDVLIPAAKNTLYDMVKTGFEMLLFGESSSRRTLGRGHNNGQTQVSYTNFYRGGNERRETQVRSRDGRMSVADVIMGSRKEAEDVLTTLIEAIDNYGLATVADYYQAAGVSSEYTDQKFGWTSLGRAEVIRVRDGYIVDLPRPMPID